MSLRPPPLRESVGSTLKGINKILEILEKLNFGNFLSCATRTGFGVRAVRFRNDGSPFKASAARLISTTWRDITGRFARRTPKQLFEANAQRTTVVKKQGKFKSRTGQRSVRDFNFLVFSIGPDRF